MSQNTLFFVNPMGSQNQLFKKNNQLGQFRQNEGRETIFQFDLETLAETVLETLAETQVETLVENLVETLLETLASVENLVETLVETLVEAAFFQLRTI